MSIDLDRENAEGWRPEPGAVLIGKVIAVDKGWSDYTGAYYPIVTVQPAQGDAVAIHAFHAVLQRRLKELRPQLGETLGVKYKGQQPSKDGKRTISIYVAQVEGRTADIWGDVGDTPPPRPPAQQSFESTGTSDVTPEQSDDDIPF